MTLRGWRRTWLGAAEAVEHTFGPTQLRNAAAHDAGVRFEVRLGRRWREVDFSPPDAGSVHGLLDALPRTRTAGFDEQWAGLQEFNRRLPLRAGRRWVTPGLVLANLAMFVAILALSGGPSVDPVEIARWANAGLLTTQGEWWRLLSASFLHWNLLHCVLNMWVLWNAGRLTERLFGSFAFLGLYLACGVLANLASVGWNPAAVSAGASGAVFGVLGALLACVMKDSGVPRVLIRAHRWSTLTFVVLNLLVGALTPATDNAAHAGGLVTGLTLGWWLAPSLEGRRSVMQHAQRVATALTLVAAALGLGTFLLRAPPPDPEGPYAWGTRNAWYVRAEAAHFRAGTALDWKLGSGAISPAEYARSIRQELLPFLEEAAARLEQAPASDAGDAGDSLESYAQLALRFVRARRDWLTALATSMETPTTSRSDFAAELGREYHRQTARLEIARGRAQFNGRPAGLRVALLEWYWLRSGKGTDHCILPPEALRRVAGPSDSPDDGPARRRDAGCAAQRMLLLRDYEGLEQRIAVARDALSDLPDGSSTYSGIFAGLSDLLELGGFPPELLLQRFAEWRRAHPDSTAPHLLESDLFHELGWAARGHGSAQEVRSQDWQKFAYHVNRASAVLDEIADRGRDEPHWYVSAISVGLDGEDSLESIRATFDEAVWRFPSYQPMYRAMLRVLMPRWRGSSDEVADFIEQMAFTQPDSAYAFLYAMYVRMEGDDVDVFHSPRVDWQRILAGLELLRSEYGSSDFVVNSYAYLACRKEDAGAYASIRAVAASRPSWTAWSNEHTLSTCDTALADGSEPRADVASLAPVRGQNDGKGNVLTAADAEWVRRQTSTALEAAEPVRDAISRYYLEHGRLPPEDVLRTSPDFRPANPIGTIVELGVGGSINMKLSGGPLDGRRFSWAPYTIGSEVQWQCAYETVPAEFLGPPCRPVESPQP